MIRTYIHTRPYTHTHTHAHTIHDLDLDTHPQAPAHADKQTHVAADDAGFLP